MKGLTFALILLASGLADSDVIESFDTVQPGRMPAGWKVAKTGPGTTPRWEVVKDDSAPSAPGVLAQLSVESENRRFPLAIREAVSCRDGVLSVRFKPISGRLDQAGGLVWRYRDADNYYIVRANALEDNVVLYKVEKGKRIPLAPKGSPPDTYGVKHKVLARTWSELSVTFAGPRFVVAFNGEILFEVEDSTFTEAGQVGVWTKADSVTHFDDFRLVAK